MIITGDGKPVEFIITPAFVADVTPFKLMKVDLPQGASIYGDKATRSLLLKTTYKSRTQDKRNETILGLCSLYAICIKERIETTFSQLTSMFPRKIDAVTKGFLLKRVIFIISFSVEQVL